MKMRIVCTKRGEHRVVTCGAVYRNHRGGVNVEYTHREGEPEPVNGPRCSLCGRNPQRSNAVWSQIWRAALDAGGADFDISGLPF